MLSLKSLVSSCWSCWGSVAWPILPSGVLFRMACHCNSFSSRWYTCTRCLSSAKIFILLSLAELQALHEMVQQKVVTLLSDPENIVKQTLMENGITRLCVFFGRQKANDVLLSHMITFLNDKNDWHLRGAFFDSIVGKCLVSSKQSGKKIM